MADRPYEYDPVPTGTPAQRQYKMEEGQGWKVLVIGGIANLGIASTGYAMGWTSPVSTKLADLDQTPLGAVVTTDEESWIGSLLNIGAILGPFVGGFLAEKVGRKWGLIASSVPLFVGWILIAAATNVAFLYAGRIFWGVAVGMLFTLSPMYCAEIATDDVRGALGSFLQLFITFGYLLIYAAGPYVSYSVMAYMGVAIVALFVVCMFFMPESPSYHLTKNNREAAAECLATLRGKSTAGVEAELDQLAREIEAAQAKTASYKDLLEYGNFKAMYISCALVFFQQFSGINAVLFYMTNIFNAAGSSLDSSISTIIIGAVQCASSFITPFAVDRLGRRLLLLISSCGTAVALGLLGMYFLLYDMGNPIADTLSFIPILSLVLFMVTYCVGLGPLPWAIMGELFPIEVKAIAAPIATAFCWTLSFLITKFFSPIAEALGMYVCFWIFGVCCVISFVFSLLIVPETKGKSFQEIQDLLRGTKTSKAEKA